MHSPYDVACPVCDLPIGANCRDENGRVMLDPHPERDGLAQHLAQQDHGPPEPD